ncbi:hypothetical protein P8C59_002700 [Phyllachora maydis]|uniref:GAG-pre-integrase domain-containing protein n=1 Tax=Phyllachora maydis TaxID=1825666 RepID=A0AAD9MBP7_9PEZI|nr:hypothetical protein P8C59_002700 [Phyllachora maydis]
MADQAKGKEDKEDGEDYSEVIEVLKQHIKSYKRVIASQSSNIKTLLLSLNTLKASIKDSVSAIKNISSTLASLTNSSNATATTTGKTSYSPRFNPFSVTIDSDSPLHPPRKEPYLGPAVNLATSNLDPPIDIGSKEGFKDTVTSSIVKELSKKAYTIPDDRISNFLENPNISNTYSNTDQAILLMLLRDSLSSGPRAAILWIHIPSKAFKLLIRQYSRPIESKKEDVYNEFHALTFTTYRKGFLAFNAEFNGYLAKLTIAKIDIDPSLILNQNPATEVYRAAFVANSSNSTPNSNSNPSKKGKNKKKASFILGSYNLAIEEEEESDFSSNSSSSSDSNTQLAQLLALKGYKKHHISNSKERFTTFTPNTGQLRPIYTGNSPVSPAGIGSITLEVLSRKAPPTYTKLVLDNVLYLPHININIVSRVRHYDSGGCLIKETLYGGDRRYIAVLDFKKSGFFLDVKGSSKPILHANFAFPLGLSSYTTKSIEPQRNKIVVEIPSNSIRKEDYRPIIEDAIVSEAIEPNKRYKLRNSPAKGTTLEGIGPSLRGKRPCRPTREPKPLTGTRDLLYMLRELVIEGNKVEKAISSPTLEEPNIGQRDYYNLLNLAKLWHVRLGHIGLRLLKKTSSITKGLPNFNKIKEADFHCSSCNRGKAVRRVSKALIPDPPRVLDLIEGDTVKIRPRPYNGNPIVLLLVNCKIDLDLDLEGAVSPDPSNLNTEKPISIEIGPSKLEPYESSSNSELDKPLPDKPINPVIVESTRPTISIRKPELLEAFPKTIEPIFIPKPIEVIAPNQPITNKPLNNSDLILEGDKMQLDYYKLLAKTSSYILPTKSHLNAAKNLFKYLNSTKDYSICFSYNGNTVADLGPKLSNSSNTTTKLSRDFHSKEGPRPLTTTSTTIVDSRNSKGSSRTSIINSSPVPIVFSNSDFTGDKATSKSTYGYLYELAGRPISWKTKRATTIALSTLEAETDGLTEAIREVQWIIGLFSKLHRPIDYPITLYRDNQGSIIVANDPALYARTKHTLLKFRYVREQVKAKIVTIIYLNTKCF